MRYALLAAAALAFGQDGPPVQVIRGELVSWQVRGLAGDMAVRTSEGAVHTCVVKPDTYLTRQTMRITPVGVKVGDTVEVVADLRAGTGTCTALTVYVSPPEIKQRAHKGFGRPITMPIPQPRNLLDGLLPRGRLTYAGIVSSMDNKRLVLRTRKQGEKSFALREDTIFSDSGREVDPEALRMQTSVYVRASQTFDGDLEVYQIIWGEILVPGR